MPKTRKPKTHFEQVPLEIVKDVAEEEIPDDEAERDDEGPAKKRPVSSALRHLRGMPCNNHLAGAVTERRKWANVNRD